MPYTLVFQMPVEFDLKLMTVIGPNCINPEWKFSDDVIHEVDSILLGMLFIRLKQFRRLATRYDKLANHLNAFLHLACAYI